MIINSLTVPTVSLPLSVPVKNQMPVPVPSSAVLLQPSLSGSRSGIQPLQNLLSRFLKGHNSPIEITLLQLLNQPAESIKTVARILKSETFKPFIEQLRQATETTVTWEKQFPKAIKQLPPAVKLTAKWFEPLAIQQTEQNTYFPSQLFEQHEKWQQKRGAYLVDGILPQLHKIIQTIPASKKNDSIDRLQRTVGLLQKTLSPITYPLTPEHPFYRQKPISSEAIQRWLDTVKTPEKPTEPLKQLQAIIVACQTQSPTYEQTNAMADLLQQGIVNARLTGDNTTLKTLIQYSYEWMAIQLRDAQKVVYTVKQ